MKKNTIMNKEITDEELLERQGLEKSIRNKLVNAKNIPSIFETYMEEKDKDKKEKILKFLKNSIDGLKEDVEQICLFFSFFEIKFKSQHE